MWDTPIGHRLDKGDRNFIRLLFTPSEFELVQNKACGAKGLRLLLYLALQRIGIH